MSSSETRLDGLTAALEAALAGSSDAARAPGSERGPRLWPATVAGTSGEDLIVELGPRVQGIVPLAEFDEPPAPGTRLSLALRGREDELWVFSAREAKVLADVQGMDVGSHVKARVIGFNKGGLECKVGPLAAFVPSSQVDLRPVEDLAALAGETLVCEVLEIDRDRRRVVLSRRAVLEEERRIGREEALDGIAAGSVVRGRVVRVEPFGAFLDLGRGLEGLLHVSNLAHRRVAHPEELVAIGQELEVLVLEISAGGERIALGRKQLEADPWDSAAERWREGSLATGTVRRLADFGAFVELEPGVDGLLHVSQLGAGRTRRVRDVLREGQEVQVRIVSVDPHARRISLSRLDERGAVLGSEEAAEGPEIEQALAREPDRPLGTNLGALFKKALGERRP
jgi:ribosomal protein S1